METWLLSHIQVLNDLRVNKWQINFYLCGNNHFKFNKTALPALHIFSEGPLTCQDCGVVCTLMPFKILRKFKISLMFTNVLNFTMAFCSNLKVTSLPHGCPMTKQHLFFKASCFWRSFFRILVLLCPFSHISEYLARKKHFPFICLTSSEHFSPFTLHLIQMAFHHIAHIQSAIGCFSSHSTAPTTQRET